ncbi:MAG TPA: hypothetical protein VL727_08085 [Puia sp.]|nr:hypothetical protein [Puia sp.]
MQKSISTILPARVVAEMGSVLIQALAFLRELSTLSEVGAAPESGMSG